MSSIMESVGKKRSSPRRAFTPEFNAEIVELCQRGDRTVGQVVRDFDLTETAVRQWVKQAELDAGTLYVHGVAGVPLRARVARHTAGAAVAAAGVRLGAAGGPDHHPRR
jgi:transposase-like protein